MTLRSRHSRSRRLAYGLALATLVVGIGVAPATAKLDEGTGGFRDVVAGGWSGQVDLETGIPLSAGIVGAESSPQVIPYLSHGQTTAPAQSQPVGEPFVAGVTDFPRSTVAPRPEQLESGSALQWADGLTIGIAAVLAALGLGLGIGFRRPRMAGL